MYEVESQRPDIHKQVRQDSGERLHGILAFVVRCLSTSFSLVEKGVFDVIDVFFFLIISFVKQISSYIIVKPNPRGKIMSLMSQIPVFGASIDE